MVAKYIFKKSYLILSRDFESVQLVNQFLSKTNVKKVRFCPDVAFTLQPKRVNNIKITPNLPENNSKKIIGININGLMFNGGYTRNNMFNLKMDYRKFILNLSEMFLSVDQYAYFFISTYFW